MANNINKCKGKTKKGKPCNKPPLKGEEYCEIHHPSKLLRKLQISKVLNLLLFLGIPLSLFICDRVHTDKSTQVLREDIRRNTLADRALNTQYNPPKMLEILIETINLMNNDPDFPKSFYIDSKGIGIKTDLLLYGKDYEIDFKDKTADEKFEDYLNSGRRNILIDSNEYNYVFFYKNGSKIDSFSNATFEISRNFPLLPIINVSTVDPTAEYLCASFMDIQIDSVKQHEMYLSNWHQNNTFKIRLKYDLEKDIGSFDQIEDIQFDSNSTFYSINQELSYYKFLKAIYSNARIRIRNAITGDSIKTTEPFLPVNMDLGRTHDGINNRLFLLSALAEVQDRWGVVFQRSNITELELAYLGVIQNSLTTASELIEYPFIFKLPKDEAEKLIAKKAKIDNENVKIICNKNSVDILDKRLPLDRLVIDVPPSNLVINSHENYSVLELTPNKSSDIIVYKFVDLEKTIRPGNIIYGNYSPLNGDSSVIFVDSLEFYPEIWINSKRSSRPLDFSEY
jgi:hypothetical protein